MIGTSIRSAVPGDHDARRAMIAVVPLKQFHVQHLELQARQNLLGGNQVPPERVQAYLAGPGRAVLVDDGVGGECRACVGLSDEGGGRAVAWSLIDHRMPKRAWVHLVRAVQEMIATALAPPEKGGWAHRVSAQTIYDWREGHRLLIAVGMSLESLQRGALPDGRHAATYAVVRGDIAGLPNRWRGLLDVQRQCLWEDHLGGVR